MLMEQGEGKLWSRKGQGSAKGRNAWREGRGRTRKVRVEKDGACISLRRGGVGQKEESICEKCAPGKIFLQSSETIRRSSWKVCERGGGKSNVDETREKKIPMERGQGTREQVNGCKKQVLRNLPQIAASCSKLQQTVTSCSRLPQAAASCNKLPQVVTDCG